MAPATGRCFLCTAEFQAMDTSGPNSSSSSHQNSVLLCKILEVPRLGSDGKKHDGINYCTDCVSQFSKIINLLSQLDQLEIELMDEKYLVEEKFKKHSGFCQRSENRNHGYSDSNDETEKFREEIISEMIANSLESVLEKCRTKSGRRQRFECRQPAGPLHETANLRPEVLHESRTITNEKVGSKNKESVDTIQSTIGIGLSSAVDSHAELQSNSTDVVKIPINEIADLTPLVPDVEEEVEMNGHAMERSMSDIHIHSNDENSAWNETATSVEINDPLSCPEPAQPSDHFENRTEREETESESSTNNNTNEWNLCDIPKYEIEGGTLKVEFSRVFRIPGLHEFEDEADESQNDLVDDAEENVTMAEVAFTVRRQSSSQSDKMRPSSSEPKQIVTCEGPKGFKSATRITRGSSGSDRKPVTKFGSHFVLRAQRQKNSKSPSKRARTSGSAIQNRKTTKKSLSVISGTRIKNKNPLMSKESMRPRKCDECDKVLASSRSMKDHVQTVHRKIYKCVCTICGVGYQSQCHLDRHMTLHTNERNFVCRVCAATFTHKTFLRSHLRKKHEGRY